MLSFPNRYTTTNPNIRQIKHRISGHIVTYLYLLQSTLQYYMLVSLTGCSLINFISVVFGPVNSITVPVATIISFE